MTRTNTHPRRGMTLLEMLVVLVIMVALGTLMIPTLSWVGERSQRFATQENLSRLREKIVNQYVVDMGELPRPRNDSLTGTDARPDHPQLVFLFVNPDTFEDGNPDNDLENPANVLSGRRWQGPYLMHSGAEYYETDSDTSTATGTNFTTSYGRGNPLTRVGDPTVIDAWGNPIVLQEPDADDDGTHSEVELQHARLVSAGRDGRLDTPPDVLMPTKAERVDDQVLFLFRHDDHNDEFLDMSPSTDGA